MTSPWRLLAYSACWSLTLVACAQPPEPTTARPVRPQCPAPTNDDYFLPMDEFPMLVPADAFGRCCAIAPGETLLSRALATMQMPTLSCGEAQFVEAYRYLAFNVFDTPPPTIVSATLNTSVWSVRTVQFRSSGDLTPVVDTTRALSNDEALALTKAIQVSRFWMTPDPYEARPEGLADGGPMVIEARRNDSYQPVRRWNPRHEPIRTLGVMLVKLAGLRYELLPPSDLPPIPPPGSR